MSRPLFFDRHLEQELRTEGYAIVDLITPEEAAAILAEVQALEPADGFAPDGTRTVLVDHGTESDTCAALGG